MDFDLRKSLEHTLKALDESYSVEEIYTPDKEMQINKIQNYKDAIITRSGSFKAQEWTKNLVEKSIAKHLIKRGFTKVESLDSIQAGDVVSYIILDNRALLIQLGNISVKDYIYKTKHSQYTPYKFIDAQTLCLDFILEPMSLTIFNIEPIIFDPVTLVHGGSFYYKYIPPTLSDPQQLVEVRLDEKNIPYFHCLRHEKIFSNVRK